MTIHRISCTCSVSRRIDTVTYQHRNWNHFKSFTNNSAEALTGRRTLGKMATSDRQPKILSQEELPASEAKWITLKKLKWQDQDGKERLWECAERKTRGSSGIDAVAILAIIRSAKNAFPPSTVIIEQYRPPIDKFIIELPAGLIDEGETPEETAIRELEEETGFKATKVLESSSLVVNDPGMTTANMKLVVLDVTFQEQLELSDAKLDEGEHIVKRIVELNNLYDTLQEYAEKDFVIDARLSHFASGLRWGKTLASDNNLAHAIDQ